MTFSSWFCSGCGKHTALIPSPTPGVVVAMDFAADGYTPSSTQHCCPVAS